MWTTVFVIWFLVFLVALAYGVAMDPENAMPGLAGCGSAAMLFACALSAAITWDADGFWAMFSLEYVQLAGYVTLAALGLPGLVLAAAWLYETLASRSRGGTEHSSTTDPDVEPDTAFSRAFGKAVKRARTGKVDAGQIIQLVTSLIGLVTAILGLVEYFGW